MTTVILIRHGESEANRRNVFAGHIDPDLEENGLLQAKLTAGYIAENYQVDAIYASDLTRAYKTALCLGELLGMPVTKVKGMREIHAGEWEGANFNDLVVKYPEEFGMWMKDLAKAKCPGGETVSELGTRIFDTLTGIAEKEAGKTVVVATHATPIRAMHSIVETGSVQGMVNVPWASNASLTVFAYENGTWELLEASVDGHLSDIKTALPDTV